MLVGDICAKRREAGVSRNIWMHCRDLCDGVTMLTLDSSGRGILLFQFVECAACISDDRVHQRRASEWKERWEKTGCIGCGARFRAFKNRNRQLVDRGRISIAVLKDKPQSVPTSEVLVD